MIIGNGLIATAFKKSNENYDNVIIFASGVSDSKETTQACFDREEKLITDTLNENIFILVVYLRVHLIMNIIIIKLNLKT